MGHPRILRSLEATAVLLFLVQAVRVLFSTLFGLIYDVLFTGAVGLPVAGAIMLCVVAAFLVPAAVPRRHPRRLLFAAAWVAALARIPLTVNWPAVRLWSSILLIAAAGIYTVTLLRQQPRAVPVALLLALAGDQFLRAAGNTYDVALRPGWLPAQIALSLATGIVAWLALSRTPTGEPPAKEGIGIPGGLALGALLFLESSLLGFPNALARWSGAGYALLAPLLVLATLLPLLPGAGQVRARLLGGPLGGLARLFLTLSGLAVGKLTGGPVGAAGLLLAQLLALTAILDVIRPRRKDHTGLALALGLLLFLLLSFALAFAFTYPYTIPTFRDKGLAVLIVGAFLTCLPVLGPRPTQREEVGPQSRGWPWLLAALAAAIVAVLTWPVAPDLREVGAVRVATYNIHYGYDTHWRFALEEQARAIEASGADVIALQEVDACRVTSYGVDDALWLARRLGMQQVYAPALEGLSGIALLSRLPIASSEVALLTSRLEQTAIARAEVQIDGRPLHIYGTWLGLEQEERALQLNDALIFIGGASPAVFAGDLNSTPDSPTAARIQAAGFEDPFIAGGFTPALTDPAIEPTQRIDFVWMRGLAARDAQVLDALASDHRLVVVDLALP